MDRRTVSVIELVQAHLSSDLLKLEYKNNNNQDNPLYGHCYVASEAVYHLLGSEKVVPCYGRHKEGGTHWWLVDRKTNEIIDPTADQYYCVGKRPPYDGGVRSGFLTKKPSKRAQIVLNRIRAGQKS
jgi:hypothetical protein